MSAFIVTMLQAITIGIGVAVGYSVNRAKLKLWRTIVGFSAGFAFSWFGGVALWAFAFMSDGPHTAIVDGMQRSFLFALVGAGLGVYLGRRQAMLQTPA